MRNASLEDVKSKLTVTSFLERFPGFGRYRSNSVGAAGGIDLGDREADPMNRVHRRWRELPRQRNASLE